MYKEANETVWIWEGAIVKTKTQLSSLFIYTIWSAKEVAGDGV